MTTPEILIVVTIAIPVLIVFIAWKIIRYFNRKK